MHIICYSVLNFYLQTNYLIVKKKYKALRIFFIYNMYLLAYVYKLKINPLISTIQNVVYTYSYSYIPT